MKTVPAGLAAKLASGVTTLCRCFRVERTDGEVFGFTDHDRTISFGGVDYEPETGFTAAATEQTLGLAVDTQEVAGALSSAAITDEAIALGLWDNAACEIWLVDWDFPADRVILRKGSLGEIGRGDIGYQAEIRGLAHALNQDQGRTYGRICDAVLGDSRCGVALSDPDFAGTGAVISVRGDRLLTVSGLGGFADGWFAAGVLTWTSGANDGASVEVRGHLIDDGAVLVTLWQRAALAVEAGDAFAITAGCDKRWSTCREKFGNGANFRGFPHIPGNDFVLGVAKRGEPNDGGSFFN